MDGHAKRRAFLLGCNSEDLAHCARDVETLGQALKERHYHLHRYTSTDLHASCPGSNTDAEAPVDSVTRRVRKFLKGCQRGDTAVFYFSGHSFFDGEVFNLVVGDDVNDTDCLLDIQVVVSLFQQHSKPANRLLILDCCEASQVVAINYDWHSAAGTWGRIWVATRKNENAFELDGDTEGGLFTAFVRRAILEAATELADADGRLPISRAERSVREWAKDYKGRDGRPAPHPGLFGNTDHDVLLADGLVLDGFDNASLSGLGTLIRASGLTPENLAQLYEDVARNSELSAVDEYRGATVAATDADVDAVIRSLSHAFYREFKQVKIPLAEFVERVARLANNGPELREWLHRALRNLDGTEDVDRFIATLNLGQTESDQSVDGGKTHLAISLWPRDANTATQYSVEARLVDADGQGPGIDAPTELVSMGGMRGVMRRVLNHEALHVATRALDHGLAVEFFLPTDLLGFDVDLWDPERTGDDCDLPLSHLTERYMVSVRSQVRLPVGVGDTVRGGHEPYIAQWPSNWKARSDCRSPGGEREDACCVLVDTPRVSYHSALRNGAFVFVLGFRPDEHGKHFETILRAGLGAVVWSSDVMDRDIMKRLLEEAARPYPGGAGQPGFADLPYSLRELRRTHWESSDGRSTGHLHLLWDDPQRIPRFTACGSAADSARDTSAPAFRLSDPTILPGASQ